MVNLYELYEKMTEFCVTLRNDNTFNDKMFDEIHRTERPRTCRGRQGR
jgi:hypothetical protein